MAMNLDIPISRSTAFPDLAPDASVRRRRTRPTHMFSRSMELTPKIELTHDSAQDEGVTPARREEPRNEIARLTVYALNAILMVIFFPVGMAILMFNIICGENLRTTAHAIALTGTAIGLSMTDLGQAIIAAI